MCQIDTAVKLVCSQVKINQQRWKSCPMNFASELIFHEQKSLKGLWKRLRVQGPSESAVNDSKFCHASRQVLECDRSALKLGKENFLYAAIRIQRHTAPFGNVQELTVFILKLFVWHVLHEEVHHLLVREGAGVEAAEWI